MAGEGPGGPLPSPPVTAGLSQPCQAHRSPATHTTHLGPSPWAGCRPGSWEADGALGGPGQGFLAGWGRIGLPGLGSIEWSPPPTKLKAEHLIVAPSLSRSREVSLRLRGEWEPALSAGYVGQHQETPALLTPKHHPRTPSPSRAPHITHVVCFSPIPGLGGCALPLSCQPPFGSQPDASRICTFQSSSSSITHPRRWGSDAGKEQGCGHRWPYLTTPPPHAGWPQLIPSLKVPTLGLGPTPFHRGPT